MLGYTVPVEALTTVVGLIAAIAIYALLGVSRLRERMARLEEWIRQYERRNDGTKRRK